MLDLNRDMYDWYIVKDFELVDYGEMLQELKRTNPNWKKLPKDIINYILSFLKN